MLSGYSPIERKLFHQNSVLYLILFVAFVGKKNSVIFRDYQLLFNCGKIKSQLTVIQSAL